MKFPLFSLFCKSQVASPFLTIILGLLMASFSSQAQNFCVVQGASDVCPFNEVTYDVKTGGLLFNDQLKIHVFGGIILSVVNNIPSATTIAPDKLSALVSSIREQVGDSKVTVRWGAGGTGRISANVRFNLGLLGGYQYNSDEINVNNGLGSLGGISGITAVSCASASQNYSINPVAGANRYLWTATNGATVSSSSSSATVYFNALQGTTAVRVYAYNDNCTLSSYQQINVTRIATQGAAISGESSMVGNSYNYYFAIDANSYDYLSNATNFNWSINNFNDGWSIVEVNGYYVRVKASGVTNSTARLSFTATDPCGKAIAGSKDLVTGLLATERVSNPILSLFPNPSSDNVTLSYAKGIVGKLIISDKLGNEVAQFENVSNGFVFSVAKFATDTYTARFITQDTVLTFRLAVNHN